MTSILTSEQMRDAERAAIYGDQTTGLELMERAGRGVVESIFRHWPHFNDRTHSALILCGPGNNGGDGFVVARLLRRRGWKITVVAASEPDQLPPDARINYQRWQSLGDVLQFSSQLGVEAQQGRWQLIVDALFGTGLSRAISLPLDSFVCREGLVRHKLVSIDIASGLCADSGRVLSLRSGQKQVFGPADLTVTFHRAKTGHVLADGPNFSGKLDIVDIGLEAPTESQLLRVREAMASAGWTKAQKSIDPFLREGSSNKYHFGHALILAGRWGRGGAARLAARSALRIGAGLVSIGCQKRAFSEHLAKPDAIMLAKIDDADDLLKLLEDKRFTALCLGPNLGLNRARELVPAALATGRPIVLDADALTAFAQDPQELCSILHRQCILTPHAGEFKRIFPDIYERLSEDAVSGPAFSKVQATVAAAERAGATVLFKGTDTVIASDGEDVIINVACYGRTAPWLATAGAGDVLAGFICGLMARGFSPHDAAEQAAWLHVECARSFGPGLIADDLPDELPKVFGDVLTVDSRANISSG
ncbi:MAG: NAD(P)H-hydrate dehydratase [Aestuariivita sp.]|nr:NAD(P)H-hydrate dehydratase [Aestuariivita sp.]MCY4347788.1 NAD(P)H-hydrate dehydratase [Aestuariivita sp.]